MKIVIYTAIFGQYSGLIRQPRIKGVDYVCFTDNAKLRSRGWQVHLVKSKFNDPTRDNRYYKILPHLHLPSYDISIYMDANFYLIGNIYDLIANSFQQHSLAFFDHNQLFPDTRDCLYEESEAILELGEREGKFKDDPHIIKKQMKRYQQEGFPRNYGLICGGVIIRKHKDSKVVNLMEHWWEELERGSKRDQLSFNYVSWKLSIPFQFVRGDLRKANPWVVMLSVHKKNYFKKKLRYKWNRFLEK